MLQCFFYGTGQYDSESGDGICVEVQIAGYRILLDCGLHDLSALLQKAPPDLVLCSHAHPDHARSLQAFHDAFPHVPLYSSEVTTILSHCSSLQALPWRSVLEILPNLTVQLFPSGHLPGAAMVLLTDHSDDRPQTLLYTGDLSLTNSRLTEGLKLEELRGLSPDVLLIEGTYGTDRHAHRRQLETQLMEKLDHALVSGQSILMTVPALGLAQEILILLRSHHLFSGRSIEVWVDGAIAEMCDLYEQLIPTFPSSIQNFARYQPLFLDSTIRPWIQRFESWEDLFVQSQDSNLPKIVLTSDQDIDRVQISEASQSEHWVLFRSHHSSNLDNPSISSSPSNCPSLSNDETYLLPDHCDGSTLPQVIHNLRPQHVIFIHGKVDKLLQLAELDDLNSRYKLHIPSSGSLLELPIAAYFARSTTLPDVTYEGELIETETEILLSFSSEITADPRWKKLADLGIIMAQWEGNTLVIRAISQRES